MYSSSYHRQHYTAAAQPATKPSHSFQPDLDYSWYDHEYPSYPHYSSRQDFPPSYSSTKYTVPTIQIHRSNSGSTSSSDNSSSGYSSRRSSKMSQINGSGSSPTSSVSDDPKRAISASVHALLISTTALMTSLSSWSKAQASEGDVSDVYVQIGTEFNACVVAFAQGGIDLTPIHGTPQALRDILENCLAEEPSPAVIAVYMPQVRAVLRRMLEGLRDGGRAGGWTFG